MKKLLLILFVATLMLIACGDSNNSNSEFDPSLVSDLTTYANKVFIGNAEAAEANGVDTDTMVWAKNVIYDIANSSISASNVQDALAEIAPDLSQTIIGTWNVTNYGDLGTYGSNCNDSKSHSKTGTITFNEDGSFSLSTHLAATRIGEGENGIGECTDENSSISKNVNDCICASCGGEEGSLTSGQAYQIIENSFIEMSYNMDDTCNLSSSFSDLALISHSSQTKIVLYGNHKVSVLEKLE